MGRSKPERRVGGMNAAPTKKPLGGDSAPPLQESQAGRLCHPLLTAGSLYSPEMPSGPRRRFPFLALLGVVVLGGIQRAMLLNDDVDRVEDRPEEHNGQHCGKEQQHDQYHPKQNPGYHVPTVYRSPPVGAAWRGISVTLTG